MTPNKSVLKQLISLRIMVDNVPEIAVQLVSAVAHACTRAARYGMFRRINIMDGHKRYVKTYKANTYRIHS